VNPRMWERIALGLLSVTMLLIAYLWTQTQADITRANDSVYALQTKTAVQAADLDGCKQRLDRIETKIDRLLERSK
jgi:hypothetical protein